MFKKLFTIDYKGKQFLILVDKNHRKTFLEVTGDGQYIYPELEDYKELNDIYNNYDYATKYDEKSRTMTYKEKVRYKALGLLSNIVFTGVPFALTTRIIIGDNPDVYNNVAIKIESLYKDTICDRSKIDLFYNNETITRDDVVNAINNNDNLDDYYKQIAIQVLDLNLELDPDINLRIYYQNMKEMNIYVKPWEVISEHNTINHVGIFKPASRSVHLLDNCALDDAVVAHEFTHAMHDLIDTSRNEVLYINETTGYSLEEAMTNRIIANKWGHQFSYNIQQKMLTFLIDNVDEFNYHIYNENGAIGLINELKQKYPDVDIDYLIDYMDTYTTTDYKIGNNQKIPYEDKEFIDELFEITIRNIDKDDIYRSYETFKNTFKNYDIDYEEYLEKYNNELIKQGFITQKDFDLIKNINMICLINGKFYVSESKDSYFDYNGNKVNLTDKSKALFISLNSNVKDNILTYVISNNEKIYSMEFVQTVLENLEFYGSKEYYEGVQLFDLNDRKLIVDSLFELLKNDINPACLYDNFIVLAHCLSATDLLDEYSDYLEKYENEIIKHNFINKNILDQIKNIKEIFIYNDKYYIGNNTTSTSGYYDLIQNSYTYNSYSIFPFDNTLKKQYIDEDGSKNSINISQNYIECFPVNENISRRIVQYVVDNEITNVYSSDFLHELDDILHIFNHNKYNSFSDGKIAFDEITDDIYVEFGMNENNKLGICLFKGNKLIYGTCQGFVSPTGKLPYDTYLRLGRNEDCNYNYINDIISQTYFQSIPKRTLEYLVPNVNVLPEVDGCIEYQFKDAPSVVIDGKEGNLRNIYVSQGPVSDINIYFFDGTKKFVCNLNDPKYVMFSDYNEKYFNFLEKYVDYFNLTPDENNMYHFTKEEITNLVNQYIEEVYVNGLNEENVNNGNYKNSHTK